MSAISNTYQPPSSKDIRKNQDQVEALRLLVVQRILYSKAKFWLAFRLVGMGLIAVVAPVITLLWPSLSVAIGALVGLWLFLGRTLFFSLEHDLSARAAAVQELFDIKVFEMPELGVRTPLPTLEEIAALSGTEEDIKSTSRKENLYEWYPINVKDNEYISVAISQRANTSYSGNLLKSTAKLWFGLMCLWVVILVALSLGIGIKLSSFLLGIAIPLLPAFLDTWGYWRAIKQAMSERFNLSHEIEEKISQNNVDGEDLVVWQTKMYNLRRETPLVFDFVYRWFRNKNEKSMELVAEQLSNQNKNHKG